MKVLYSAAMVAAILTAAVPAQAALSQVTIANVSFSNQFGNPSFINATQQNLLDDFFNKPSSVTFQYDTDSVGVGGVHAVTLVSGTANGDSSVFDGFTASLKLSQASFNQTWDVMDFFLTRNEHGSSFATTQGIFTLVDSGGGLFTNVNTLPSGLLNTTIVDQVNGEIRINGGAFSLFGGGGMATAQAPPPTGNPVPEPATWAMMLLGFLGLGGVLRRRRTALAAA